MRDMEWTVDDIRCATVFGVNSVLSEGKSSTPQQRKILRWRFFDRTVHDMANLGCGNKIFIVKSSLFLVMYIRDLFCYTDLAALNHELPFYSYF